MDPAPAKVTPHDDRAIAVAYCAGRDVPCTRCSYNLRDSTDAVCPECGITLVLRASDDQRPRRAVLGLLFMWNAAMSGGAILVTAAYWAVYSSYPGHGPSAVLAAIANISALLYGVAGMVMLVRTRRRPIAVSRWWVRIGWLVLLGFFAQYLIALIALARSSFFGWSLYLPF